MLKEEDNEVTVKVFNHNFKIPLEYKKNLSKPNSNIKTASTGTHILPTNNNLDQYNKFVPLKRTHKISSYKENINNCNLPINKINSNDDNINNNLKQNKIFANNLINNNTKFGNQQTNNVNTINNNNNATNCKNINERNLILLVLMM